MAVNVSVLNEANGRTGSITVDFVLNILASEEGYPLSTECEFYFTVTTNKNQVGNGNSIAPAVMKSLSGLSLNGAKQSRSDTAVDYTSVTDMVQDYLYDFIHGHTEDQFSSGVSARGAMDI